MDAGFVPGPHLIQGITQSGGKTGLNALLHLSGSRLNTHLLWCPTSVTPVLAGPIAARSLSPAGFKAQPWEEPPCLLTLFQVLFAGTIKHRRAVRFLFFFFF